MDDAQIFGKHQVSERPAKWTEWILAIPRLLTSTQSTTSTPSTKSTSRQATEMNLRDCVIAFLLTEVVEITVALLLGYRRPRQIMAVFLVNLVTNPSVNYLVFLNDNFGVIPDRLSLILFLELAVIFVEWALLVIALRENKKSLLGLSFVMNTCSYLAGVLIFGW